MRLGARRTVLQTVDCIAAKLYQSEQYIDERHRHRWVRAGRDAGQATQGGLRLPGNQLQGVGCSKHHLRPSLAELGALPLGACQF